MTTSDTKTALIVGVGPGLSASIARRLAREGYAIGLAARDVAKLSSLAAEIGAQTFTCDVAQPAHVERLFADCAKRPGGPDVVVFNPSARTRGAIATLEPADARAHVDGGRVRRLSRRA